MRPSPFERFITSAWHLGLFAVGIWERKHHKSHAGKILATGFALWHLDAAIADARGEECLLKKGIRKIAGIE